MSTVQHIAEIRPTGPDGSTVADLDLALDVDAEALPPFDVDAAGALTGRIFETVLGTLEVSTIYLGEKLGFYRCLTSPRTVAELADATGVLPRYVQEWLEQQAIAGLISVDDERDPEARRFWLDAAQAQVFTVADSPFYTGAMALLAGGCAGVLPRILEAYRSGTGLAFGEYGDDVRVGQGMFNKASYFGPLVEEWLPAMPDVLSLLSQEGARALDVGCGVGWSTLALAGAFPGLSVLGVDSDEASILDARANAEETGAGSGARFEVASGDAALPAATYDVAFLFECLHDMAYPVPTLRAIRESLRPGGLVVVMDGRAEEEFAPDGSPMERLRGAASVLHCLPVGLSEPDSAGTGTLLRPDTMRRYAAEAGFAAVELPPIEDEMMRFYVLRP